jgi:hypothetical protein
MLDVRALAYVLPLDEQPQASILPTVTVKSFADEDATLTGTFRIYRESTGLLEYSSAAFPTALPHGTTCAVAAQTPFSPSAIVDDDYFVNFDGVARSASTGLLLPFTLGSFHFDIKAPAMGPAPAQHHATHELSGSDEIDCTGLPGTGGAGVTDHGALTGLDDHDHPQYLLHHEYHIHTDFTSPLGNYGFAPWYGVSIGAGTGTPTTGTSLHPGIFRISSAAAASTGYRIYNYTGAFVIAGNETSICWFRPIVLASIVHVGFFDTATGADPTDGVWLWQDPATGIMYGRTMNNTVGSQTGSGFQLVVNTWYAVKLALNADASRVDFEIYDEAGALLWSDFLTTNIPTAAARVLGHGFIAVSSAGAAAITDIDYLAVVTIDRRPEIPH